MPLVAAAKKPKKRPRRNSTSRTGALLFQSWSLDVPLRNAFGQYWSIELRSVGLNRREKAWIFRREIWPILTKGGRHGLSQSQRRHNTTPTRRGSRRQLRFLWGDLGLWRGGARARRAQLGAQAGPTLYLEIRGRMGTGMVPGAGTFTDTSERAHFGQNRPSGQALHRLRISSGKPPGWPWGQAGTNLAGPKVWQVIGDLMDRQIHSLVEKYQNCFDGLRG